MTVSVAFSASTISILVFGTNVLWFKSIKFYTLEDQRMEDNIGSHWCVDGIHTNPWID